MGVLLNSNMAGNIGLGLAIVIGCLFILGVSGQSAFDASENSTDCRLAEEGCSRFALVGECNETSGLCTDCDLYNQSRELDCFFLDTELNRCRVRRCWTFFNGSRSCREGSKSRLTALLLSIFLINFGAANFYIERYELAVPQIILGLLLCFFEFGSCATSSKREDLPNKICVFCCATNSLLSVLFLSWWLADLIIFATNSRNDGDGCPLST